MNPYDLYVANRLLNRLQQYILFHVDYCKLIHKAPKANDSFIGVLCEEYQILFEDESSTMQVNRGKVNKYLGTTLEYSTVGQVKITMLDYIDEIIDTFDQSYPTGRGTKSSAAPDILFKVDKYCKN